ncbi:GNAT family N-acetyltransferase [Micromonospora sp. NPDC048843]|uniref:GNAT family N-acetyltransferase n=1 Tax=Micromonospora sp. NPDC048843 TaxID=3155389 RepID=UPI0033D4D121
MTAFRLRPYRHGDESALLALVRADPLPGHPPAQAAMLALALAGDSPDDAERWAELNRPAVTVLTDTDDRVAGVVSYALRKSDRSGNVLWLHAREEPAPVAALLEHALGELSQKARRFEAFTLTTPLNHGFDGILERSRPTTHAALLDAGFEATYMGRYFHRPLVDLPVPVGPLAEVGPSAEPPGRQLRVHRDGKEVARAVVCEPVGETVEIYWLSVEPAYRGQGIGRQLWYQAMAEAARTGAKEAVLIVDDDEPGGERDRTAAVTLYDSVGWKELDRVHTYRRD